MVGKNPGKRIRTLTLSLAVIALSLVLASPAMAAFPDKPLTVVVPYKAGGSTDTMIRVFAKALAKEVGQPVVVQNRAGAGGAVGGMYIKNSKPDGHTFLVGSMAICAWSPIHDKVDYTADDFTYLGAITEYQQAVITTPDKPFKTLKELIAYSKKNPGVTFAEQSSLSKLVVRYVAKKEGLDWRAVPTKGGGGMGSHAAGRQDRFCLERRSPSALWQKDGGIGFLQPRAVWRPARMCRRYRRITASPCPAWWWFWAPKASRPTGLNSWKPPWRKPPRIRLL